MASRAAVDPSPAIGNLQPSASAVGQAKPALLSGAHVSVEAASSSESTTVGAVPGLAAVVFGTGKKQYKAAHADAIGLAVAGQQANVIGVVPPAVQSAGKEAASDSSSSSDDPVVTRARKLAKIRMGEYRDRQEVRLKARRTASALAKKTAKEAKAQASSDAKKAAKEAKAREEARTPRWQAPPGKGTSVFAAQRRLNREGDRR
mmetsp:Transcript_119768/g.382282  ORF Transcript_119768/g.382282 Transcript_119768/m.382282 type:complete len:204 (+) Transcript_119768:61-672(+)